MNDHLRRIVLLASTAALLPVLALRAQTAQPAATARPISVDESPQDRDARMRWWREARFGLFIHWGLYAVPAGKWADQTGHGEWIRDTAQIPVAEYDKLVSQFNPVKFDADEWVRLAADAGMRYIVITSKHHDGFCLFDSKFTDYDVMSTPFRRDVLKELSGACERAGLRMCFYHSIMDWHHPDYWPHRPWEKDRPGSAGRLPAYIDHMKQQLRELCANYGDIGVLWFDGEWDGSWTHERGVDLYNYVRGLRPGLIVNNRVDVGRDGMAGMTKDARFAGDFGTPEQEIPATGMNGADWETCMTMNDHWGYNQADQHWKSSQELIRMLIDIASKGGNFLLNVGPTAEGTFPPQAVERLADIGRWMKVNGDAIYGTRASPFRSLPWGRCTVKPMGDTTRLYLHVFDWPGGGSLRIDGLLSEPKSAFLLTEGAAHPLAARRDETAVLIDLPPAAPDPVATVVVLDVAGRPDVADPPTIDTSFTQFVKELNVLVSTDRDNVELRYTLDGSTPRADSTLLPLSTPLSDSSSSRAAPEQHGRVGLVHLADTSTLSVRAFRAGRPVSGSAQARFERVLPRPAFETDGPQQAGLHYEYYEGDWDKLPDFDRLQAVRTGAVPGLVFTPRRDEEHFAFRYSGYLRVPAEDVYRFGLLSDDGSRLEIDGATVVDNDGLHSPFEKYGTAVLAAGAHPVRITFFEKTGGDVLELWYENPGSQKKRVPAEWFLCDRPVGN